MRYTIIGDMHHRGEKYFEAIKAEFAPDVLICLGDFDTNLAMDRYREVWADTPQVIVPGNHDYTRWVYIGPMSFIAFRAENVPEDHYTQVTGEIKRFLDNLFDPAGFQEAQHGKQFFWDKASFGEKYRALAIHGGLEGHADLIAHEDAAEEIRNLWIYMKNAKAYQANIEAMTRLGYNLMFRGHDHRQACMFQAPDGKLGGYVPKPGKQFRLEPDHAYIINSGALFQKEFAVIDTTAADVPMIEFYKL